ncbi:MAG: hypothetical protein ACKO96_09345 [Flammeovirgaceae bacterium]
MNEFNHSNDAVLSVRKPSKTSEGHRLKKSVATLKSNLYSRHEDLFHHCKSRARFDDLPPQILLLCGQVSNAPTRSTHENPPHRLGMLRHATG